MGDEPTTDSTGLEHLEAALAEALELTRTLAADPVLTRLLAAFRLMPAEDRGVVVGAIEREVKARKLSLATEDVSGQSMVPNPNARFYLRAHESSFDRNLLERDEMTIAMVRAMRAATLIPAVPDIYASFREASRARRCSTSTKPRARSWSASCRRSPSSSPKPARPSRAATCPPRPRRLEMTRANPEPPLSRT